MTPKNPKAHQRRVGPARMRVSWILPEDHVDLMALCISLYQVMCPDVLRCQYRQMYTSKKKNILTVNNSYINSLLFLLFKTNYFRFHTKHHWASSAGPSASTGAGAEASSGGAWHHCIKMGKRWKETEGDWMKMDREHFKNLGHFHNGLHSDQSSFIKLLIFNIFRCFS